MFEFHFLGTGNAGGVPLWGCDCLACEAARQNRSLRRRGASAAVMSDGGITLVDAALPELGEAFRFEQVQRILLTHFHMDHVQGLFPLRWSERPERLPVYRPDDLHGADDLYKHPGVLEFQPPCEPFTELDFGSFIVTPVPLIHSRVTQGFIFRVGNWRLAYLTDTRGLPDATLAILQANPVDDLVMDCSDPPRETPSRNHNDLNEALSIWRASGAKRLWLTHIGHRLDLWLKQNNVLPDGVQAAYDGLVLGPAHGA